MITTAQLHQLGFSDRAIQSLTASGFLIRVHRGVYAVGHGRLSLRGRWLAAVLACGPDAVLSHQSAVALHGLRRAHGGPTDVTAPGRRAHAGVRSHTFRRPPEQTVIDGIPVTTLERTLIDYAEVATGRELEQALTQAQREERLNLLRLREVMATSHGRRGLRPLAAALEEIAPLLPTRSQLEERFLELVEAAGLPQPLCNVRVDDLLVDFYWPEAELVVEVDGYAFHRGHREFEDDRRRDTIHTLAGRRTIRPTYERITRGPEALVADLRRLLDGRWSTGG